MNGHSVIFGQLVQTLEQITPNSFTLQDDQNEWSQCSIWTAGSKVRTNNTKQFYSAKTIKMNGHGAVFGQLDQKLDQIRERLQNNVRGGLMRKWGMSEKI